MYKITFTLGNEHDAIRQLKEYKEWVKNNLTELVKKLIDEGVEIAKAKIIEQRAFYTGELAGSMKSAILYKEGNKGIIFTDCDYACFVEFGTGVLGSSSPHPTKPWAYDIHGHGETGWAYFNEREGRWLWSRGMPSRPFMYETARELEGKLVTFAKEVFAQ